MATFGSRLSELLLENKMTHKEFAEKLNVHKGTISNWTTDRRFPDRDMLLKISDVFNVTVDYLIGADSKYDDPITDKQVDELWELFEQLNDSNKELVMQLINNLIDSRK